MHARWTWFAGSVRERETHARSDSSFSENDTSITRRGAAITISPSANPTKGDMDIVKPKRNPPRCVRIHGIDTLVTMEMTRRVITNVAAVSGLKGPMGHIIPAREYPNASFRDVTAPNADTLYTQAFFD